MWIAENCMSLNNGLDGELSVKCWPNTILQCCYVEHTHFLIHKNK
jgi:hypothetical protein